MAQGVDHLCRILGSIANIVVNAVGKAFSGGFGHSGYCIAVEQVRRSFKAAHRQERKIKPAADVQIGADQELRLNGPQGRWVQFVVLPSIQQV
jgi:hypothetical protein